jgi:hypothetical protein
MNDPRRLIEEGATDRELQLLRAGALEEPPPDGMRLLAAFLSPPSLPPPPSGAPGPVPGAVKALQGAAAKLGAKWLAVAVGAVGALGLTGAVAVVHGSRTRNHAPPAAEVRAGAGTAPVGPAQLPAVHPVEPSPPPAAPLPAQEAPVAEATPSSDVSPRSRTLAARGPGSVRSVESSPEGAKSIALEIRALDRVRALLESHDPRAALAQLDEYSRNSPRGALGQEATLLRIEALVAVGDTARAGTLAERFLRDHPNTLHEKRLRSLVGGP